MKKQISALILLVTLNIGMLKSQSCELFCNGDFDSLNLAAPNTIFYATASQVPCWHTDDPSQVFEIWGTGYVGVPSYDGQCFLELNGSTYSSAWQDITVLPGSKLTISFAHRGRSGIDTMVVKVGPVGGPYTQVIKVADGTTSWGYYSVTYTIPNNGTNFRVMFTPTYAAGGATVGNFLDAVSVSTTCALISKTCYGDTTEFIVLDSTSFISFGWNFDDPSTGPLNSAFDAFATHVFSAPGNYNVQLITVVPFPPYADTVIYPVTIVNQPQFNLGNDTMLCLGQSILLSPGISGNYLWNTGSTNATWNANASGTYIVTVSQSGCANTDTIEISYMPCSGVIANLACSDTNFCEKKAIDFFDLSINNPTSWQWTFTGAIPNTSTDQNPAGIYYSNYGSFDVQLIACNGAGCDTILFSGFINEFASPTPPSLTMSNDTIYCLATNVTYNWYNVNNPNTVLATTGYYYPLQAGQYYVTITDSNECNATSASYSSNVGFAEMDGAYINCYVSDNLVLIETSSANENIQSVLLYDVSPKLISSEIITTPTKRIELAKPQIPGFYYCKVLTNSGLYLKKLIVNH
ncbi:MAG: carbohydrate binding domain-containing protein [Bacteroidetes bacterium]|nr:carbohydrate binding domain-containing protein [Bacteroidota bacterium]